MASGDPRQPESTVATKGPGNAQDALGGVGERAPRRPSCAKPGALPGILASYPGSHEAGEIGSLLLFMCIFVYNQEEEKLRTLAGGASRPPTFDQEATIP
jgi:hypothetical protein